MIGQIILYIIEGIILYLIIVGSLLYFNNLPSWKHYLAMIIIFVLVRFAIRKIQN
jgi:hypothetical protein